MIGLKSIPEPCAILNRLKILSQGSHKFLIKSPKELLSAPGIQVKKMRIMQMKEYMETTVPKNLNKYDIKPIIAPIKNILQIYSKRQEYLFIQTKHFLQIVDQKAFPKNLHYLERLFEDLLL